MCPISRATPTSTPGIRHDLMAGPSSLWPPPAHHPDVMNQLCRVCGEPAAGFHFGAFTCEGCKSFFGRTYNNLSSISECKNNGECVINKKNRTSCKACRLRKCLLVGMSKSGSRYGRRSNWFKIHCLLQEQGSQSQQFKWDEDNNNVKGSQSKEPASHAHTPPQWRLPPGLHPAAPLPPLFGFPLPPLHPFYLTRPPPPPPPPVPVPALPPSLPPPPPTALHHPVPSQQQQHQQQQQQQQQQPPTPQLPPSVAPTSTAPQNPLELLRSLGPVQDSPMDLSVKMLGNRAGGGGGGGSNTSSSINSGATSTASSSNNRIKLEAQESEDEEDNQDDDEVSSEEMQRYQQHDDKKTPLDLTCVKT